MSRSELTQIEYELRTALEYQQRLGWLRKNVAEVKPEWLHNGCYNDADRSIHIVFHCHDTFVQVVGCIGTRVVNERI